MLSRWFADEVQPHERSLRSYLRSAFPSLPDMDELVQESYARLLRAKEAGRVSYVKAFLFTTARNAALNLFPPAENRRDRQRSRSGNLVRRRPP